MSDAAVKLNMPELSGNLPVGSRVSPARIDPEQIKREAYAEGLEQGRLRGEQLGRQQAEKELQTFRQMMDHLHQPLIDLDNQILESLAALAVRLAGQLLHRELELEPSRLIPVIASAIEQLPLNNEPPRVLLNPQQVELIASAQAGDIDTSRWVLVADQSQQPGECQVSVGLSRIDLGLDARLGNLLATLLAEDAPIPG
ncbi:MAG: FliH/SctL family protein [Gammaproteobacteria bacterium]